MALLGIPVSHLYVLLHFSTEYISRGLDLGVSGHKDMCLFPGSGMSSFILAMAWLKMDELVW